jgi:hypothetical protein
MNMTPSSGSPVPRKVVVSLGLIVSALSVFSFNQLQFTPDTLSLTKRHFWGLIVAHDWSVAFAPDKLELVENTVSLSGRPTVFYGFELDEADSVTNGILFSSFDSRKRETAERRMAELIAEIGENGSFSKTNFPGYPFLIMGLIFTGLGLLFCKSDSTDKDELKALLAKYK